MLKEAKSDSSLSAKEEASHTRKECRKELFRCSRGPSYHDARSMDLQKLQQVSDENCPFYPWDKKSKNYDAD